MKFMENIQGIKGIRDSFKTRHVKYGGYAAILTLAVIVSALLVNLIAGKLSLQIDMTDTKVFSLSPQTLEMLETITTPITMYGLWRPGEKMPLPGNRDFVEDVTAVLNLYTAKNRNITLELVDPDRNPGFVSRYDRERLGIARGSLIVESGRGFTVIPPTDMYDVSQTSGSSVTITGVAIERRLTGALLSGMGSTPVIYEIIGHDEIPLSAVRMQEEIEKENFILRQLNLLTTAIPDDASVLILHSPRRDLAELEVQRLLGYLENGGRFLVLADFNIRELSGINEVLGSYGLAFNSGIVHETNPNYYIDIRNVRFSIPDVANHDITATFTDKAAAPMLLSLAMPLSILETRRRTLEIMPLAVSSPDSFLRTDVSITSQTITPSDIPGRHILMAAVTDTERTPEARIAAIGSGSLLQFGIATNRDLFLNSLLWLTERNETVLSRSKSLFILPLRLTAMQALMFAGLFIVVIPAALFTAAFVMWLKRRHL